jgi:hypothetical protein
MLCNVRNAFPARHVGALDEEANLCLRTVPFADKGGLVVWWKAANSNGISQVAYLKKPIRR